MKRDRDRDRDRGKGVPLCLHSLSLFSISVSLLFLSLILLLGLPSSSGATTEGKDLASLLHGLGAKSRRDVRQAITALGRLNDPCRAAGP